MTLPIWLLLALVLAGTQLASLAQAQRGYWNPGGGSGTRGGDEAREAGRCGGAIGLEAVLRRVRQRYPGRLLDAAMSCGRRGPIYILKMRGSDNRIRVIRADATNGRILSQSRR